MPASVPRTLATATASAAGATEPRDRVRAGPLVVLLLLILSLLAWRDSVYYTGGSDPVVLAKAVVAGLALALAWHLAPRGALGSLRPRTLAITAAYVGVSMVGALAAGDPVASGVLGLRLLMVVATVALLVLSCPPGVLIASYAVASAALGLVLAVSGVPLLLGGGGGGGGSGEAGRLTGVLLPTSPNQLAILLAPPALVLAWRVAAGGARSWQVGALGLLLALTLLTGSRAGLAGLVLGMLLVLLLAPRKSLGTFAALVLAVPGGFAVLALTTSVTDFFVRGGVERLLTLNSRTTAWGAAWEQADGVLSQWIGQGLAVRTVPVRALYVDTQVLDSTWVSTYVQVGGLGLLLLTTWVLGTLWRAARDRSPYATLWLALAVYAVTRSVLENGLIDTYVLFVVMLVPALSLDRQAEAVETDAEADAGA